MARTAQTGGSRGVLRGFVVTLAVLLAAGATAAAVLTDDPQRLRVAVVGALWAFVLLALALPRRRSADEAAPATADPGAEAELRRAYEMELEREVAARREYELQLEVYLRRELEQGLAQDVQALREEVARVRAEVLRRLDEPPRIPEPRISEPRVPERDPYGPRTDAVPSVPAGSPYSSFPSYAEPRPAPYQPAYPADPPPPGPLDEYLRAAIPAEDPLGPTPPAPRPPRNGEAVPHRRRARSDAESNEVLSRLLGR